MLEKEEREESRKALGASGTRVPPLANPFHFRKNCRLSFAHSQATTTTFSFSPQRSSSTKNNDAGRHKVAHCCRLEQRGGNETERKGRVQELGARVKEGKERKFRTNGVRTRRGKGQQSRSQHEQKQEREKQKLAMRQIFTDRPAGTSYVRLCPLSSPALFFFFLSEPRLTLAGLQRCFSPRSLGMHGKSPRPAQGWFRSRGPLQHGPRTFTGAAAGGIGLRLHSGQASSSAGGQQDVHTTDGQYRKKNNNKIMPQPRQETAVGR